MSNNTSIVGNLTRDPEVRYTQSGRAVTGFGVAVNRRWQKDGEWQEEVSFIDCTLWAEAGENLAESLHKGDRVMVQGRLEQQTWETESGDKRSKIHIVVDEIGPTLRWATAVVTKVPRKDAEGGPRSGGASFDPDGPEPF